MGSGAQLHLSIPTRREARTSRRTGSDLWLVGRQKDFKDLWLVCWKSTAESDSWPSLGSSFSWLRSASSRQRGGTVPGLGQTPSRALSTAKIINTVAALLPLSTKRPAHGRIPVSRCPSREAIRRDRPERSGRLRLLADRRELDRVRVSPR